MNRSIIAAVAAAALIVLVGCGGSSEPKKPDQNTIGKVGVAYLAVPQECLKAARSGAVDESILSGSVDTLISAFNDFGPNTPFKLAENGEQVTMTSILQKTRDALRACEQAGISSQAGEQAQRIEQKLDSSG